MAERAVAIYKHACDGAVPTGCAFLGVMYERGAGGLTRDDAMAAALYEQACTGDDPRGCAFLGMIAHSDGN